MAHVVRPMTQDDAVAVVELAGELGYLIGVEDAERRIRRYSESNDHVVLVAVGEGRPIGWVHAQVRDLLQESRRVELAGLVVTETARGRGVGEALIDAVADWARTMQIPILWVLTNEVREDTHRFYEARGFTLAKRSHVYVKGLS